MTCKTSTFLYRTASEDIKITLGSMTHMHIGAFRGFAVIALFCPDIQYHTNGQEVEISQGKPDLQTSEKEQRRGYVPAAAPLRFFLTLPWVRRLSPHSSRISGRI